MAELEELEQEQLDEKLLTVEGPGAASLPDVPTAEPQASTSKCHSYLYLAIALSCHLR